VKTRDAELFNAMWQDAVAARKYLVSRGSDPHRIGLLGASVGCSVAIDAASRTEMILGACVMTPGMNYLGVDTMADLPGYGDRPLLILSSREEANVGAQQIRAKLGASAELVLFDVKKVHGTRMFGKVEGVEERIVDWFAGLLAGGVALDGRVDGPERFPEPFFTSGKVRFHVRLHRNWLHVVASGETAPGELTVAWSEDPKRKTGRSVTWFAKSGGFRHEVMRDGKWTPMRIRKAPNRPEPAAARDEVVEVLVPIGKRGLGLEVGPALRLMLTAGGASAGWQPLPK
jgi:hypothetical protein